MSVSRTWFVAWVVLIFGGLGVAGCGAPASNQGEQFSDTLEATEPVGTSAGARTVIVTLGDSLTAGLGLTVAASYPGLLQEMFRAEGYSEVEILNAGVSGDTSAGGRRRVESLLGPDVKIMVVALGANDALRGVPVSQTRQELAAIIDMALESGVEVLLAGMEGPTNLGEDYRASFRNLFVELSSTYGRRITYVPFLLAGVAGNPALNQEDGIHPNEAGARVMADQLYPRLRDMVDQLPPAPEGR